MALGKACCTHNVLRCVIALCVGHAPPDSIVLGGSPDGFTIFERLLKVPLMPCDLQCACDG